MKYLASIGLLIGNTLLFAGCCLWGTDEEPASAIDADGLSASNDVAVATTIVDLPPATNSPPTILRKYSSANFDTRKLPISMIVLHYTAANFRKSLNELCRTSGTARVSAHYLVDVHGEIYQLVDETRRAWHAGVSKWRWITDVNSASIGIEIVNLGHDKDGRARPYPADQIEAVIRLCLDIQSRHDIQDVVGHSDVAPMRKIDPGELFPWRMLYDRGVRVTARNFVP